ncbi:transcriptional regulator with XRE-family HTH domain [Amycolatopsis bartoniae]|uniref:Transcriptional regulator n=1 Tax=Amycolatopsis bartoniae TaxID=941986 RepID=A0A8H9MAW4_9PSEU|nr:helix-turn-helix transcriptional regulator [Amycolatopsis bartoniae]MBB2937685.1 transcriptional regulator with XRE-family HTH domain [Amycolatopsis bartoniae]TVT08225.1 helix-turn-helix domain-containing protein [Amycolatopsis bartoniae]GHF39912.1 transcriptional regulator [Amycolatopsis bartoniae]
MSRQELARFLRDRRERLRPADVGLPAGSRRRTPGLRREEVAALAAMSVDYYVRLEQARGPRPSPRILDAVAGALRLTEAEHGHLVRLAEDAPAPAGPVRRVRPHVANLLERLPGSGAIVTDATYTVIGWNPLARALYGNLAAKPNLARRYFLEGHRPETGSGAEFGHIAVARLRAAADRYPRDEPLRRLLAELRAGSEEFRDIWRAHPVHAPGHRTKTVVHPEVGRVRLHCDVLTVPEDDQQVVFVTADPGSSAERALRHLVHE